MFPIPIYFLEVKKRDHSQVTVVLLKIQINIRRERYLSVKVQVREDTVCVR